ncbi:MAG: recombinase-like helix-turn-helix domain-containing protein [Hyphomicrobiaceae bacterium]
MQEPWSSLKHQSLSRPITEDETRFARALEAIYIAGVTDFAEVARRLTAEGVVAPISRATEWTPELLQSELATINASLDEAYARHGIGA